MGMGRLGTWLWLAPGLVAASGTWDDCKGAGPPVSPGAGVWGAVPGFVAAAGPSKVLFELELGG